MSKFFLGKLFSGKGKVSPTIKSGDAIIDAFGIGKPKLSALVLIP